MRKIFPLLLLALLSCQNDLPQNDINATLISSVDELGDGNYFSKIGDFIQHNDDLIIMDLSGGQIIRSDFDLNYHGQIGSFGGGPQEYSNPTYGYSHEDGKFYCYDPGNGKFLIFSDDYQTIDYKPFKFYALGEFFIKKDILYFFDRNTDQDPLFQYSFDSEKVVKNFGKHAPKEIHQPLRFLTPTKNGFLSIFAENKPIIEVYSDQGEFIREFDFTDIPLITENLSIDTKKNFSVKGNVAAFISYKVLVWDLVFEDDKLYLLTTSKKDEESAKSNTILQFNWDGEEVVYERIITLPEKGWYSRFTKIPKENTFIAFDEINGTIDKLSF